METLQFKKWSKDHLMYMSTFLNTRGQLGEFGEKHTDPGENISTVLKIFPLIFLWSTLNSCLEFPTVDARK